MSFVHFDEGKKAAMGHVKRALSDLPAIERALVVADLFGNLRLVLWLPPELFERVQARLRSGLESGCGLWWSGEILNVIEAKESERFLWEHAWEIARRDPDLDRLRVLDRHRNRTAWFTELPDTLWTAPEDGAPVVVFYSFKGGVGRSTALASFAIRRARYGERVVVVDFDLDAPGVGRLLAADDKGETSHWGTVDFLLERSHGAVPLSDYYRPCRRVAGKGDIIVFPAGRIDGEYADKLARVDFDQMPDDANSSVLNLLKDIQADLKPKWILLDARTGVSEPAGYLLSGLAHLHALFGTTSEQSWQGLNVVIDKLGRHRVLAGRPQAECVLVQALVPAHVEASRYAIEAFTERARSTFTDLYYAEEPEDPSDDRFWDVRDLDNEDAPHVPVPIVYEERLVHFRDIVDVADLLAESAAYRTLEERIAGRFEQETES